MEPSTLTIKASFTVAKGRPATGLTLADIAFRLVRVHKNGTGEETVWVSEPAHDEVAGTGMYIALYREALLDDYSYFASAVYGGAVSVDSRYSLRRYYGKLNN